MVGSVSISAPISDSAWSVLYSSVIEPNSDSSFAVGTAPDGVVVVVSGIECVVLVSVVVLVVVAKVLDRLAGCDVTASVDVKIFVLNIPGDLEI